MPRIIVEYFYALSNDDETENLQKNYLYIRFFFSVLDFILSRELEVKTEKGKGIRMGSRRKGNGWKKDE